MNPANRKGETTRIAQRNVPVAKQVAANHSDVNSPRCLVADIRRLRKGITLGGKITIRQLIDSGRRY